ncbi:ABC transporter substrate-binding protein [Niveispirillum sp. KHB5.9]|uniref:ABC transporter substrate-binding protein n=1 Tax=Niveispirillum sp. KHB5.9 TaxID=3400269 RepID=UPI003A8B19F0
MRNTRHLVGWLFLVLALLLPAHASLAQEPPPAKRVYMVLWRGETEMERGFRDYLEEQGLAVDYTVRNLDQNLAGLPDLVAEIKRERPDLVYSWGTSVTQNLVGTLGSTDPDRHVTDIPTVFIFVTDPVAAGIVEDLDRPGRPLTGTSHMAPLDSQLNAMEAVLPLKKLGNIFNAAEANSRLYAEKLAQVAEGHGIQVLNRPIPQNEQGQPMADAIPALLDTMVADGVDCLYIGPDSFLGRNAATFTQAALERGLRTFAATEQPLRGGKALMGLVSSYYNLGRFTAAKAKRILADGTPPGEIPVETLRRFTFLVNMDVARQLDTYPPMSVLRFTEALNAPTTTAR